MDRTTDPEYAAFRQAASAFWSIPETVAPTRTHSMPLVIALSSLPVVVSMLTLPVASIVIAEAPAAANDICAVLGALIASVLTLVEARKKDRTIGHTISVFLGTASVGAFLPGIIVQVALMQGWLPEESVKHIGWQAWAMGGLVFGMNAWWLLHGINRLIQRRAEKYFDEPPAP